MFGCPEKDLADSGADAATAVVSPVVRLREGVEKFTQQRECPTLTPAFGVGGGEEPYGKNGPGHWFKNHI